MTANTQYRTLYRIMAITLLLTLGVWAMGLKLFVDNVAKTTADTETITDGIVVLTGGSQRVYTAIDLLNQGKAKRMLISGVASGTDLASIFVVTPYLPVNIAELSQHIDLGYEAHSTKGNAEEAAKWVKENGFTSIRLVTANYHMSRSMLEFRRALPDVTIIANPVIPFDFPLEDWWHNSTAKKVLIIEYHKYLASLFHLVK